MKISEMIKELQNIQEVYGDLTCYYASDDEGNEYRKVAYTPTAMFRLIDKENELRRLGEFDTCIEEHEKEYKFGKQDKDFTPLKSEFVVCVN